MENLVQENQRLDGPYFVYINQLKEKSSSKEKISRTLEKGKELLEFRKEAQMIFQDPYASLDGRMKVRDIIAEGIDIHGLAKRQKSVMRWWMNCLKQLD